MKPSREIFLEKITHAKLENHVRGSRGGPQGWGGAPTPLGRAGHPRGRLVCSFTSTPSLLDSVCSEKITPEGFILFGLRLIFLFFETLK